MPYAGCPASWTFRVSKPRLLFGLLAAGASAGGLAGPLLGGWLVTHIGLTGLMVLSAALLAATLPGVGYLFGWRKHAGAGVPVADDPVLAQDP